MARLASLLALSLVVAPIPGEARCLKYEPAVVRLVGELTTRTLPGPPNYVSIAQGDYPEDVFILRLDEAICVSGDPSSPTNSRAHSGLTELQVVVRRDDVRSLIGRRVHASGTLFAAQSGHHRTPVVLKIASIRGA